MARYEIAAKGVEGPFKWMPVKRRNGGGFRVATPDEPLGDDLNEQEAAALIRACIANKYYYRKQPVTGGLYRG